jgi:uncharacterized membrane protein
MNLTMDAKRLLTRRASFRMNSERGCLLFLSFYSICLLVLLPRPTLWLDEILDLIGARMINAAAVVVYAPQNSGGVPLGYLVQFVTVKLLGYSAFAGRLPSALFSVISCAGIFVLARRLGLKRPLIAVVIFAVLPLQSRYALEARPYSQALCLTIWSTAAFFGLVDRPNARRTLVYSLCIIAGLYTQPFTLFVPLAHFLALCLQRGVRRKELVMTLTGAAIVSALLAFLPWYLYARQLWHESVLFDHAITFKVVELVLRELTGAGYLGTILILISVVSGFRGGLSSSRDRIFWCFYIAVPIGCAIAADAGFGYFVAIRQMIFSLAPISIVAAFGFQKFAESPRRIVRTIPFALIAVALFGSLHLFFSPRENWASASEMLTKITAHGGCVAFVPNGSAKLYTFFEPELAGHQCDLESGTHPPSLAGVAVSPYEPESSHQSLSILLREKGFRKASTFSNSKGPIVEIYKSRD